MKPSHSLLRTLVLLCLMIAPSLAREAVKTAWVHSGPIWTCNKQVSVTVPAELTAAPEDDLLAVKMGTKHIYAAYGLSQDKDSADAAIKKMRKHLKELGKLKLGKIARIATNPKLHLVAREGQVKVQGVPYYVAMGYFTNKSQYLSFLVCYQSSQADLFKPTVAKLMNSVKFT